MGQKKKKEAKEKPLEKMTAKELRETALTTLEIVGVHGMNKTELIESIKKARGIVEDDPKRSDTSVREIKEKIRELKKDRQQAAEKKDAEKVRIFRRRISRLKKKTRRAA